MADKVKKEDNDAIGEVKSTYILEFFLLGGSRIPLMNEPTPDLKELLRLRPELAKLVEQTICYRTREVPIISYEWRGKKVTGVATEPMEASGMTFFPATGKVITKEDAEANKSDENDEHLELMEKYKVKTIFATEDPNFPRFGFNQEVGDRVLTPEEVADILSVLSEPTTDQTERKVIPVVPDKNRKPFDYKNESAFKREKSDERITVKDGKIIVEPTKTVYIN
ncbi:MAG: hypothetical protein HY226_00300 [Candidatus Vogelbacteria bacterium]|nr:hypothetical protein [Candidatus Vogelbacteria bacterium]